MLGNENYTLLVKIGRSITSTATMKLLLPGMVKKRWLRTPRVGFGSLRKTLPGLEDFYMAGHWVEPGGGLPAVLMSGRNVAQIICKKDKKKFTTSRF